MFGLRLKEKFPGVTVVGIEPGRAAAALAATRLDRVICSRLEAVDFASQGLAPGEFDTVIAADVLEHMVNPWEALVRIRPLLAPGGQFVASIPNVRNLGLLAETLLNGRWRYAERGLLDITHLRFFTLEEIRRMFEQTGYRLEGFAANVSPNLAGIWRENKDREAITLTLGRLTLRDLRREDLVELCAEQFLVRARLA
jgi:2-polyprenyl-3-methyl-5-hydroxy-6-metoxy-1,4-benzoquinol methylase